jgi:alkylhydroperoxidase family enzyme
MSDPKTIAEMRKEGITIDAIAQRAYELEGIAEKCYDERRSARAKLAPLEAELAVLRASDARARSYAMQHRQLQRAHRLLVLEYKHLEALYLDLKRGKV